MKKLFLISLLCLGFFCPNGFAATTPITKDNYYLIGASGGKVGVKIYTVSFVKVTEGILFFINAIDFQTYDIFGF